MLILSPWYRDRQSDTEESENTGDRNSIQSVPEQFSRLTNLQELYLGGNQISDLTPLAALTSLTSLELGGNQISDLTPLAALTSLTSLELGGNQISDLTPLAALTSLTSPLPSTTTRSATRARWRR